MRPSSLCAMRMALLRRLSELKQGAYKVDAARSAIAMDGTKAFPKNTEVEAVLTFVTDAAEAGRICPRCCARSACVTMREHQSFIELPGPGFTPRRFDPRAGYFPTGYRDYSAPLGEPLDKQFILRHRLIKKDPNCADRVRRGCSRSSITWIAARRSRSARRWSMARAGGTRLFRRRGGRRGRSR